MVQFCQIKGIFLVKLKLNTKPLGEDMRKLMILLSLVIVAITMMSGCASTGKHVKDTVDNVQEYALFGDEYTRW